jgi:hypothetical protein
MKIIPGCSQFSDKELLAEIKRLAEHERVATADLIATLAELDARRLYLGEGMSRLFRKVPCSSTMASPGSFTCSSVPFEIRPTEERMPQ